MDIRKTLETIGLTEGECQVYEALISLGQTSTGAITKKAKIASSKVYEVLDRLQQKGLASFVLKNGVRVYDATPPERLIDFLEEKKEGLSRSQEEIKKIIPLIKIERNKAKEHNKTVVYTGREGPIIVLNEILEALKNGQPNCGYGTDEDDYEKYLPQILKRFVEKSKKHEYKTRLIFGEGYSAQNVTAKVRHLPKAYLPPVRTMIYGDKVAIVNFMKPWTTIIIENKEISESYLKHFNMLWKIAKK